MANFSEIVEKVVSLETEQMEEIKDIISKVLVEKRRASFLKNHHEALKDAEEGKLFGSNNPTEIAQWLKSL
ncbi:MAG: hypothetical protein JWP81_241 [Ferruginibacter sp.]|nr:hypothetical protein [Ferruginibacter sp.]